MAYVIVGLFIIGYIFSNPARFFKQLFVISGLILCGWLAFTYTTIFFVGGGGLLFLLIALGGVLQWMLIRNIRKFLKNDDLHGLENFFQEKDSSDKKSVVEFLAKSEKNHDLLKYIFIKDFFYFARKNGSGDVLLFEKSDYEKYAKSIWQDCLPAFNYLMISNEFGRFYPGWEITAHAPIDHKTKKKVDLIRLENMNSENKTLVINMDDE